MIEIRELVIKAEIKQRKSSDNRKREHSTSYDKDQSSSLRKQLEQLQER